MLPTILIIVAAVVLIGLRLVLPGKAREAGAAHRARRRGTED